jgi:hypothetical protein
MKLNRSQAVYVIYNPDFNITKIGISDNVNKRKKDLQNACGCELLVHYNTAHIFNADAFEIQAHKKLAEKRRIGEWFNCTPEEAEIVVKDIVQKAISDPIIDAYINGVTISKIAQDHGVTRQAILSRLTEYGYKEKPQELYDNRKSWEKYGTYISTPKEESIKTSPTQEIEVPIIEANSFLDEEKPKLPITGLKRIEPNLNFNGEWYQVSKYINGAFFYAYTKDVNKARAHIKQIK